MKNIMICDYRDKLINKLLKEYKEKDILILDDIEDLMDYEVYMEYHGSNELGKPTKRKK